MMEKSNEFLIPLENESNDESIAAKTSLTFDTTSSTTPSSGSSAPSPPPKFDSLLDKLRKGMSELTSKGDDFTKQMFQMYNTLEDIVHSSKMTDNTSKSLEQIFVANNQTTNTEKNSKSNILKINNNCINNSVINNSDENVVNANTKSSISQSNQSFHSSIDSNDSNFSDFCQQNNNDIKHRNNNICNNNNNNKLNSNEKSRQLNERPNNSSMHSINNESINSLNTFSSNHSINVFDNTVAEQHINNNNNNNVINNHLSVKSQSESLRVNKRLILKEKKRILQELDKTNGYINRNCINSSDHIVNPLLDTINTLTSCSDSSDECDINKKCYSRCERHRRIFNGSSRHLNRKSCNYYYSSSDAESVSGYTGTNSLESGYKSDYLGSNTPEVIDGSSLSSLGPALDLTAEPSVVKSVTEAVNQAISHQMTGNESSNTLKKKNTSKQASNESSAKNSFERNSSNNQKNNNNNNKFNEVLDEKQQNPNRTPDDMSSNASVDSFQTTNSSTTNTNNSRKTVGMFSEKIANRWKAFHNDSQLEHLLKLRKSLLKALKRCEQISSPANSRDGSPTTAGISLSSRSSSPASTIVRNTQNGTNSSSNSRRLRDDISCSDKCRQRSVASPLTIRSNEELDRSCDQLSTYSMNSMNSTSNNHNTNNSKSVRFNGSVKFNTNQREVQSISRAKQQITTNYVSNKSILKDPLCETLRSSIKAGEFANNCSLEGEIDELLYGRTGPYYYSPSLEPSPHLVLDECLNPSSSVYVSRLEEKYRTFTTNAGHTNSKQSSTTSTAANSKKTSASNSKDYTTLKTGFPSPLTGVSSSLSIAHESEDRLFGSSEPKLNPNSRPLKSNAYSIYGAPHNSQSSSTYGTKSNRKSTKTHFTEMAKCMLEILDDLQPVPQNVDKNTTYKHLSSASLLQNSLLSERDDETDSIDLLMKELSNGQSDTSDMSDISSISYRTFPEQHIYEEILYEESLEPQPKDHKTYVHYVPSRRGIGSSTANTFAHSSANRVEAPILQSHIRHVGSWGRTSNKPKQRSNLYTIFSDESERRNISRSLEREFSKRNPNDCNTNGIQTVVDNYGFKV